MTTLLICCLLPFRVFCVLIIYLFMQDEMIMGPSDPHTNFNGLHWDF